MKKLMILGGSRYILPVIEAAHSLGVYVITADYIPDNIAHKYSDEYVNVSVVDKNATLLEAKKRKIDGIMSFACDPGVVTAAYVAEQMGLPSVGSYEAVNILQNKGKFRKFLAENGFNVPVSKAYKDIELALSEADLFNWPVIVKPTDSAGSKGVTKVLKKELLKDAIKTAISYSIGKEFIIEDYLEQKGFSSDCDSFSINGRFVVFGFNSQRFDADCENPYTPSAYSWPSSISKGNIEFLKSEIQRVVSLLNLSTSVFNIEVRECVNGKPYIMELTPRGGGNRLSEMMKCQYGVDFVLNSVKAALGMVVKLETPKENANYLAEIILHSKSAGVFDYLWISEDIKKNIVQEDLWIKRNSTVGGFKGANEAIGTLVLNFDSQERMEEVLANQDQYVRVVLK